MKIAILGHGAMGQLVASRARLAGHEIGLVWTSQDASRGAEELKEQLRGHDAAIDFSVAEAVFKHAVASARAGVPLIEGTTGWKSQEGQVREGILKEGGALVYGANFSVGVHVFYRLAEQAATLFRSLEEYDAFIEEAHHKRKRDAPSGTALHLRDLVSAQWRRPVPVTSTRAGYIPGTHRLGFDSAADQILLTHRARSREGFAAGALLAAQWIRGRRGVFEFSEVIDEIMKPERTDIL